jgi:hypothetical protein
VLCLCVPSFKPLNQPSTLCQSHTCNFLHSVIRVWKKREIFRKETTLGSFTFRPLCDRAVIYHVEMWLFASINTVFFCSMYNIMDMIKAVPLQACSGPEGPRKLRFPDFMTTAQGSGKFVSHTHRPHLPPGNSPGTHIC